MMNELNTKTPSAAEMQRHLENAERLRSEAVRTMFRAAGSGLRTLFR